MQGISLNTPYWYTIIGENDHMTFDPKQMTTNYYKFVGVFITHRGDSI